MPSDVRRARFYGPTLCLLFALTACSGEAEEEARKTAAREAREAARAVATQLEEIENAPREVLYEVEGTTSRASVTLETSTGTQQSTINVPLKNKSGGIGVRTSMEAGDFAYLSAQNKERGGEISCRITVDGDVISENTSTGGYVIASCSGRVP